MRRPTLAVAVPVLVIAALLVGCARSELPTTTPTGSAVPDLTPTPTSVPVAVAVPAFGGNCGNVLDAAQVDALRPTPDGTTQAIQWQGRPSYEVAGAMQCFWAGSTEAVHVTVLPAEVVPESLRAQSGCRTELSFGCGAIVERSGAWILVEVLNDGEPDPTWIAAAETIAALIADRSTQWPKPVALVPTDRWWSEVDCAELAETVGVASVLGESKPEIGRDRGTATLSRILMAAGRLQLCEWGRTTSDGGDIGTAWIEAWIEPGAGVASTVALPGGPYGLAVSGAASERDGFAIFPWSDQFHSGAAAVVNGNRLELVTFGDARADPVPLLESGLAILAIAE